MEEARDRPHRPEFAEKSGAAVAPMAPPAVREDRPPPAARSAPQPLPAQPGFVAPRPSDVRGDGKAAAKADPKDEAKAAAAAPAATRPMPRRPPESARPAEGGRPRELARPPESAPASKAPRKSPAQAAPSHKGDRDEAQAPHGRDAVKPASVEPRHTDPGTQVPGPEPGKDETAHHGEKKLPTIPTRP
jgi:hypothetical protein